jgi:hypothetical protein
MLTKEATSRLARCLVACNIYVSAGLPQFAPTLLQLLNDAQEHCRQSRKSDDDKIAIVHAFADGPYDRSSYHIAGSPFLVADVASRLAISAVDSLTSLRETSITSTTSPTCSSATPHPTVGIVDHVAVLPLAHNDVRLSLEDWLKAYYAGRPQNHDTPVNTTTTTDVPPPPSEAVPSGWVARSIGGAMESSAGVEVFFYGHADAAQRPLATVRREATNFFRSLPPTTTSSSVATATTTTSRAGQATVGASPHFVENYNIRLTSTKSIAQSLTKHVRERDGGLPCVEALTLPYSQNRFEVACNLLDPEQTSIADIDQHVREWRETATTGNSDVEVVGYRVGTTAAQCLEALGQTATPAGEREYNRQVRERFADYLADR